MLSLTAAACRGAHPAGGRAIRGGPCSGAGGTHWPELAAILKCFLLDVCATMSWPEFQRSWASLQALASGSGGAPTAASQGRARAAAAAAPPAVPTSAVRALLPSCCKLSLPAEAVHGVLRGNATVGPTLPHSC